MTNTQQLAELLQQAEGSLMSAEAAGFLTDCRKDLAKARSALGKAITLSAQPHPEQDDEPTPPEILACKLIETWCRAYGRQIPWEKAVEITAITTSMRAEERDRLLAMADAPAPDLAEGYLKTAEMMDKQCRNDVARALGLNPLGDGFAWSALLANIKNTVKAAQAQQEPRSSQWTYASLQATNCAGCGKHKHTPLRVDWMGGYVCLTCIDEQLEALHEIAEAEQVPERLYRALAMVTAALEADGDRVTSVTALRELQAVLAAAPAQGVGHA